jgi:hypothetical protein
MEKELLIRNSARYGAFIFAGLVVYFLVMKFFNLAIFQELRFFNGVIIFVGVALSISRLKKFKGEKINYFFGFGGGMLTSLFASVPFALFVLIYLLSDDYFLAELQHRSAFGMLINPFIGAFVNFIEGMAAGLIASFMVMQYLKPSILKGMKKQKKMMGKLA